MEIKLVIMHVQLGAVLPCILNMNGHESISLISKTQNWLYFLSIAQELLIDKCTLFQSFYELCDPWSASTLQDAIPLYI